MEESETPSFKRIGCLGSGSYGEVVMFENKTTAENFALKIPFDEERIEYSAVREVATLAATSGSDFVVGVKGLVTQRDTNMWFGMERSMCNLDEILCECKRRQKIGQTLDFPLAKAWAF